MYKRRLSRRMPHYQYMHFQWNRIPPILPLLLSLLPIVVSGFGSSHYNPPLHGVGPARTWGQQPCTCSARSRGTTQLLADLSFSGDSNAVVELEAPFDHVQEWLQTPSASDLQLLGTNQAKRLSSDPTLWECQQPRIDFMGLDLQPYFIHRVERRITTATTGRSSGNRVVVHVKVVDSRTDILNPNNPANQVVGALMGRAKFSGASRIQAIPSKKDRHCQLVVDLSLKLHVPLPPFVLLPPGFNSVGSSIVSRTSKGRTEKLVQDLKLAYLEWAATTLTANSTTLALETQRQIEK